MILCLSGGGFRATLFHLGVIRRLIKLGLFESVTRINSVSGGSFTAGMTMMALSQSPFKSVQDFDNRVIKPLIGFIQTSPKNAIYRLVPFYRSPIKFAGHIDKELFHGLSFADLTNSTEWCCYATSLNSGMTWKFSQNSIGDSATGFAQPTQADSVSIAVAASACFPPLFRALPFRTRGRSFVQKYVQGELRPTKNPSPPPKILLVDGGVYDNLGTESAIKKNGTISFFISDASGVVDHWGSGTPNLMLRIKRPFDILSDQTVKLRRRLIFPLLNNSSVIIEACKPLGTYTTKEEEGHPSPTAVSDMPKYPDVHRDLELGIGMLRTHLNSFHDTEILCLIWNGMVKTDAVLKRWCPELINRQFWNDVPVLRVENPTAAMEILSKGQSWEVLGEQHEQLHGKYKLSDNLSEILGV